MALPERRQEPVKSAVIAKALLRAADLLGLTARELAPVIGLSEATLSRLRRAPEPRQVGGKSYELALLFIRLYRSLDAITGGDDAASRSWMRNSNDALGGMPVEKIRTVEGLTHVLAYLDARRAPV